MQAGGFRAARRVFLRYAATNVLILLLPLLTAALSYRISLDVIQRDVDAITVGQLERSMTDIERLFADLRNMSIQLSNDYEINHYLNKGGDLTGIELYNMKRISGKLASYVLGNPVLAHCFLSLPGASGATTRPSWLPSRTTSPGTSPGPISG